MDGLTMVARRDPWLALSGLRSIQDNINRWFAEGNGMTETAYPPMNVWVSEDAVLVEAEVPGMDPQAVDVSVTGDLLTVSGERPEPEGKEGDVYHRQERFAGRFSRMVQLPFRVQSDKVEAGYRNGILSIRLPRTEEDRARRIAVQSA